jgi:hypothetical protein
MSRSIAVLTLVLLAAVTACMDPVDTERFQPLAMGAVEYAEIASPGDTVTVGVRVIGMGGVPVPDVAVTWSVVAGGGQITPVEEVTDASGLATAHWALGPAEGTQVSRATGPGLPPVDFTVNTGPPEVD